MWYVGDEMYAVLYVRVNCFVVRDCAVSRGYINVCNCDMFSVVNMYLTHLKFCVVCINGRRYVCCSECYVFSNECDEPTPYLVQPIGAHGGHVVVVVGGPTPPPKNGEGSNNCFYAHRSMVSPHLTGIRAR